MMYLMEFFPMNYPSQSKCCIKSEYEQSTLNVRREKGNKISTLSNKCAKTARMRKLLVSIFQE